MLDLDPDPYQMNIDPKPWKMQLSHLSSHFRVLGILLCESRQDVPLGQDILQHKEKCYVPHLPIA
jgi:hypothetical protein